jgi:hypothetical protein
MPVAIELVRKFYANLHACGEGHFMTWLRDCPIKVDTVQINTITHTPRVLVSEYPWAIDERPPRLVLVRVFRGWMTPQHDHRGD